MQAFGRCERSEDVAGELRPHLAAQMLDRFERFHQVVAFHPRQVAGIDIARHLAPRTVIGDLLAQRLEVVPATSTHADT